MVKFYEDINGFKKTILFIHELGKSYNDWNITKKGKILNIEQSLSKTYNTVLIKLETDDYFRTIEDVANDIASCFDSDRLCDLTNVTIVAHGYGVFYAYHLVHLYPDLFVKLFLIDPICGNDSYKHDLKMKLRIYRRDLCDHDIYSFYGVKQTDSLEIKKRKLCKIMQSYNITHVRDDCPLPKEEFEYIIINEKMTLFKLKQFDTLYDVSQLRKDLMIEIHYNFDDNEFDPRIEVYNNMINNEKSRLCLYYKFGHMLHHKCANAIKNSIKIFIER